MTRPEFVEAHKAFCERMHAIMRAKNADYCGASEDPFSNFRMVEHLRITSVETGILTRMSDKLARIVALLENKTAEVKDETILDSILDMCNYGLILASYLKENK